MQENSQIQTTPPLSGPDLVSQINSALTTIASDFSGDNDPAAMAGPYMTWADTANGLLKRRNAANTAWVTVGKLFVDVSLGRLLRVLTFTSSGLYTRDPNCSFAVLTAQGGGGAGGGSGGAGSNQVSLGGPGAAGAFARGLFTAAQIGASLAVTIGAGGTAVSNGNGNPGGTTSIGALISATGGPGGSKLAPGGFPNAQGNGSVATASGGNMISIAGVSQFLTVAHSLTFAVGGAGGNSIYGQGGAEVTINTNGIGGIAPGSGGSGTVVNQGGGTAQGGFGAGGIGEIWEFA